MKKTEAVSLAVGSLIAIVGLLYVYRIVDAAEKRAEAASEPMSIARPAVQPPVAVASLPAPTVVPAPAEPAKVEPPAPTPVVAEAPPAPQYVVPADAPDLSPMNGWIDQPDRTKPGRMHTNLRVQWANGKTVRKPASYGGDCWRTVTRPPERLTISGGTVDILAPRRITIPCQ